jgi:hypothetical protein
MPITPEQRAEWQRLADAATAGPWRWEGGDVPDLIGRAGEPGVYVYDTEVICFEHNHGCACRQDCEAWLTSTDTDRAFIAAAREAVPALLADNVRLTRELTSERAKVAALVSALERTEINFQAAVSGKPVRDMAENLAENRAALADEPGGHHG